MSESRRNFFRNVAVVGAGLMSWAEGLRAQKSQMDKRGRTHPVATRRRDPPVRRLP